MNSRTGAVTPIATAAAALTQAILWAAPSPAAPQADYSSLLITVRDLDAPESYTATTPTVPPGGQPGATTTFSNATARE
ncbi:hypothetical protein A5647_07065 [Mycobacterium sp. 1100029.7]|nr:hypothetical protein A5647_07065 [Mycobacterium sp. 1100029.7]